MGHRLTNGNEFTFIANATSKPLPVDNDIDNVA
jgi:hypothetical protein